ncbi:hypothetical protein HMPREF9554_02844 [Treponema phagedenis F0421]|nr:hypothetical protein HMPREF9554_02844 [Treponema phagedenis F0421]
MLNCSPLSKSERARTPVAQNRQFSFCHERQNSEQIQTMFKSINTKL